MPDNIKIKSFQKNAYNDKAFFGGNRLLAIQRDGEKCVRCGMTRQQHKDRYGVDITVDHIDNNGRYKPHKLKNNSLDNLQTLCLPCHSSKDNRSRKLTDMQVANIRHARGELSSYKMGALYGVSAVYIRMLWRNEWRKLDD